jgi:hypothetical protein
MKQIVHRVGPTFGRGIHAMGFLLPPVCALAVILGRNSVLEALYAI